MIKQVKENIRMTIFLFCIKTHTWKFDFEENNKLVLLLLVAGKLSENRFPSLYETLDARLTLVPITILLVISSVVYQKSDLSSISNGLKLYFVLIQYRNSSKSVVVVCQQKWNLATFPIENFKLII